MRPAVHIASDVAAQRRLCEMPELAISVDYTFVGEVGVNVGTGVKTGTEDPQTIKAVRWLGTTEQPAPSSELAGGMAEYDSMIWVEKITGKTFSTRDFATIDGQEMRVRAVFPLVGGSGTLVIGLEGAS